MCCNDYRLELLELLELLVLLVLLELLAHKANGVCRSALQDSQFSNEEQKDIAQYEGDGTHGDTNLQHIVLVN